MPFMFIINGYKTLIKKVRTFQEHFVLQLIIALAVLAVVFYMVSNAFVVLLANG